MNARPVPLVDARGRHWWSRPAWHWPPRSRGSWIGRRLTGGAAPGPPSARRFAFRRGACAARALGRRLRAESVCRWGLRMTLDSVGSNHVLLPYSGRPAHTTGRLRPFAGAAVPCRRGTRPCGAGPRTKGAQAVLAPRGQAVLRTGVATRSGRPRRKLQVALLSTSTTVFLSFCVGVKCIHVTSSLSRR